MRPLVCIHIKCGFSKFKSLLVSSGSALQEAGHGSGWLAPPPNLPPCGQQQRRHAPAWSCWSLPVPPRTPRDKVRTAPGGIPPPSLPGPGCPGHPCGHCRAFQGWRLRDAAPRRAWGSSGQDTAVPGAERAQSSYKCQNRARAAHWV